MHRATLRSDPRRWSDRRELRPLTLTTVGSQQRKDCLNTQPKWRYTLRSRREIVRGNVRPPTPTLSVNTLNTHTHTRARTHAHTHTHTHKGLSDNTRGQLQDMEMQLQRTMMEHPGGENEENIRLREEIRRLKLEVCFDTFAYVPACLWLCVRLCLCAYVRARL
jgi:hypothetical protein